MFCKKIIFCCWTAILAVTHGQMAMTNMPTRGYPPVIVSVTPSFGSAEGGTQITISGANFQQSGMFSSTVVLINNQQCNIINYYTFDNQITCVTPKCVTVNCLSDPDWQGTETVSLAVYVQTVEGILGTSTTFRYDGGYTAEIFKMSHYTYGTAMSSLQGTFFSFLFHFFHLL